MFILIVGDNAHRASGLEQTLADFGLTWEVCRVADAAAALSLPGDRAVDVLVTEVAGDRGAALLGQLRVRHPDAVRILLLDQNQGGAAMQALDCAHRLLPMPLDAGELIEAIESVIELRELLDNPELKRLIGGIESLPTPPRLYLELSRLLQDPDVDAARVSALLSRDPAIVAKILRMCNSAYFSAGRIVTDIRTAVTRLGQQTVRRLVLATEAFDLRSGVDGVDREAMQDRALRTSRLAGKLLAGPSAEFAATAGLLAEIGKLLPGVRVDDDCGAAPADPARPHYADAGAYLLGLWGLPMPIVEAVASHHRPSRMRLNGFWVGGAVHVASALVANTEIDEHYLRSVGMIDKLPKWRSMAEDLAAAA